MPIFHTSHRFKPHLIPGMIQIGASILHIGRLPTPEARLDREFLKVIFECSQRPSKSVHHCFGTLDSAIRDGQS